MPWLVFKDGRRGIAVLNCPGSPAWGDGGFCPGGGMCARRARGGPIGPDSLHVCPILVPSRRGGFALMISKRGADV